MKKSLQLLALLFIVILNAQAPQKFSYQAVIRNASNALITNANVGMKISILKTTNTGTVVYAETQTALTNSNGLVSVQIGNGSVISGTIAAIDWNADSYFLKTEIDPAGGTTYSIAGTSQLLSVPYALNSGGGAISGTTDNLIKFTGPKTGGNSIISESTGSVNIGNPATPSYTSFFGPSSQAFNAIYEGNNYRGYFGSYSGANEDVDFGTGAGNAAGSLHLTIMAVPKMTIDNDGKVGIGTITPDSFLQISGERGTMKANFTITNASSGTYPGIMLNSSALGSAGAGLYGRSTGGLNVSDSNGIGYGPVFASAFTVSSDIRTKKEVKYLTETDYDTYLKDLRKISSATYRYNWENKQSRPESHLGFISQSLPNSVQMAIDQSPSKSGEPMIGYNLSDMAGLTVIVLKALDAKLTAQQEIIQKLQKRLELLEK